MKTYLALTAGICLFAGLIVAMVRAEPKPPAPATPAAYEHVVRLVVREVTAVERVDRVQILKLEVERFYGKIEARSLERAKQHETQRFTILFPAALESTIKAGDILDYRLSGYLSRAQE